MEDMNGQESEFGKETNLGDIRIKTFRKKGWAS